MKQTRAFFNRFSIGVTALWLLLFALLPNIGLLVVTVLTRGEQDFVLPQFTLDNYLRLLDPTFLKILWESLWLAFMSTLACLLVGYPFAYRIARASAKELGLTLREGVYFYCYGPQYETPAEVRAARILGGDAVGMSTAPEVIVAGHCGMQVLGFTLVSNMAAGILDQPLSEQEVLDAAEACKDKFSRLVLACLERL